MKLQPIFSVAVMFAFAIAYLACAAYVILPLLSGPDPRAISAPLHFAIVMILPTALIAAVGELLGVGKTLVPLVRYPVLLLLGFLLLSIAWFPLVYSVCLLTRECF